MEIQEDQIGGVPVISLHGRLDAENYKEAQARISESLDQGNSLMVLDLEKLEYVSSAGLRVILSAAKRCHAAGGELRVAHLQAYLREIFDISGLTQVIALDDNSQTAAEHLLQR